jgi:TRAP-type C4-dicarboxylate transport system substrate-binding protein
MRASNRNKRLKQQALTDFDGEATMKSLVIAAGVTLAALGISGAQAQDKPVELRFGYWVPPAHPLVPAVQAWGEDIAKASNGTIKVTVYPAEQLGKAFDHYDMARDGIADIALVSAGYQPGRFPIIEGVSTPFLVANEPGGTRALDEFYRKYAATEMKDVRVCHAFVHDPGVLHTARTKVVKPEDLKGLKIRPAGGTIAALVTSLGGTNVSASAPEARDVIEKGVADGLTFPWESIFLFHIEAALKYHMDVPLYVTPFVHAMNRDKYNSMSAAQKKVIDDHCTTEWSNKIAGPWGLYESGGRAKMKALAGHDVYSLSPAEVAAWKKAAEPLKQRWADAIKKNGNDPDKVIGEFEATLKKYAAAY